MSSVDTDLYAFHQASIHERRLVSKVCAALPLLFLTAYLATLAYGLLRSPVVLLVTCAILNTSAWLWIASTAVLSIVGAFFASDALHRYQRQRPLSPSEKKKKQAVNLGMDDSDQVVHLIVLPNYKEDEGMLAETLQSLSEADDCDSFCVVLAMEERELNSQPKGERLKQQFQQAFAGIAVAVHPSGLQQNHLDGSVDLEVPGKASNLKWAVPQGFAEFQNNGIVKSSSTTILTVADADCIFHPGYFSAVSREFTKLRESPGNDHLWTMYQAPQLPYRNYFDAVAPCRIWAYISSAYEFGGVTSLSFGGTHMTFSGYSLPLKLALEAGAWDGDVIAEDHHAFLKCFYYSALASVSSACPACVPQLKVQPIYLPVKSTSVSADTYWRTCADRWWQAKRHAQGSSEFSYAVLAAYDAMTTLPWRSQCCAFYLKVGKVISKLFCMHLLPTCQGVGLMALSLVWFYHGRQHPLCPSNMSIFDKDVPTGHYVVCGLAGAWILVFPTVILTVLLILANYLFLRVAFIRDKDAARAETIWDAQDGGMAHGGFSQSLTAFVQTSIDCTLLLGVVMVPYGFFSNVAAYIDVALHGNKVKYVTASKPAPATNFMSLCPKRQPPFSKPAPATSYGTLSTKFIGEPRKLFLDTAIEAPSSTTSSTASSPRSTPQPTERSSSECGEEPSSPCFRL